MGSGQKFKIQGKEKSAKPTTLEGKLRGITPIESGDGFRNVNFAHSNYQHLFRPYTDKDENRRILGTKAVNINITSCLKDILEENIPRREKTIENITNTLRDNLTEKYGEIRANNLLDGDNYLCVFWSNTSEIHHRDMMVEIYKSLRDSAATEDASLPRYEAAITLQGGIDQIQERISSPQGPMTFIGQEGNILLANAQGYQLSSVRVPPDIEQDSERLKEWIRNNSYEINSLQVSSAITTDQESYQNPAAEEPQKLMSVEDREKNLQVFLDRIKGMQVNTSAVETGNGYLKQNQEFPVDSWNIHEQSRNWKGNYNPNKQLRILYDENLP